MGLRNVCSLVQFYLKSILIIWKLYPFVSLYRIKTTEATISKFGLDVLRTKMEIIKKVLIKAFIFLNTKMLFVFLYKICILQSCFVFNLFLFKGRFCRKEKNTCISRCYETHFCVESRLTVLLWIIGDFDDAMTHKALILDFRNFINGNSCGQIIIPWFWYSLCQSNSQTNNIYERYKKGRKDAWTYKHLTQ